MFKKKLVKTLVSTTMAVVLATTPMASINTNITAIAAEVDSNGFVIEDGVLTSYEGNGGAVEIPSSVTKIGAGAFSGNTQITSVTIPGSVTVIDERAFYGCSSLQSVTFTTGLKSIEKWAFYGCSSLTSVVLPEGLESIGGLAFYNCSSLKEVTIPESVSNIGASAFSGKNTNEFIIYGYTGTTAESYANTNDIEFAEVGSEDSKNEDINSDVTSQENSVETVTGKCKITKLTQNSLVSAALEYAKYKGAKGYQIVYATNKKFTSNKKTVYTTKLSYTLTGLKKGKTYYVKIRAYKISKNKKKMIGKYSAVKKIKIASTYKPKVETEQLTDDSLMVRWDKVGTATGYQIMYGTDLNFTKNVNKTYSSSTGTVLSQLTIGECYYIKVRAYKSGKSNFVSSYSNVIKIYVRSLEKNMIVSIEQTGETSVNLTYKKISGATEYEVYYSKNANASGGFVKEIKADTTQEGNTQSVIIDKLMPGETYYFTVEAIRRVSGKQAFYITSDCKEESIKLRDLEPNKIVSINQLAKNTVNVTYSKVSDATGYYVSYSKNWDFSDAKQKSCSIDTNQENATQDVIIKDLEPGTTYYFKVQSYKKNASNEDVYLGSECEVKEFELKTEEKISNENINCITDIEQVGTRKVEVTFSRMLDAKGYQISYATNENVKECAIDTIDVDDNGGTDLTQSVIFKDLIPGTTYYFEVTAYDNSDNSKNNVWTMGSECEVEKIKLDEISTKKIYLGDVYSFDNPDTYGYLYEKGCYYNALREKAKNQDEEDFLEKYIYYSGKLECKGRCFGMSCIFVLNKAEALKPEFYNCMLLNQMEKPSELGLGQVSYNVINYYHITQSIGKCYEKRANYNNYDETPNNRKIVETIKSSNYPVVVGFDINITQKNEEGIEETSRDGGHAVVAVDMTEDADGYTIKIWDPNILNDFVYLYITRDFKESKFSDGYTWETGSYTTHLKYALAYEDSRNSFDEINIQNYIEDRKLTSEEAIRKQNLCMKSMSTSMIRKQNMEEETISEECMMLNTNYMNFTITCSNGSYAVIKNGNKIEGDLEISFFDMLNEPGEEYDVFFRMPALNKGENYSITPKQHQKKNVSAEEELEFYYTKLSLKSSSGYYAKVTSEIPVTLSVSDDGNMKTSTENGEAVAQTLKTAFDDPSRMVEGASSTIVQGTDTGFSINSENKKVQIRSDNKVDVNVTVREDFQSLDMGKVSTESGMVEISGSENSYAITDAGGKELVRKEMGYIVRFNLMSGQDMDGLDHVPSGSLIQEPQNITREGYTFEGWYTSSTFEENTKWDFSVNTVTSDVDLYAKWVEIPKEPLVFIEQPTPTPRVTPMPIPTGAQIVTEPPTAAPTGEPTTTTTKPSKPSKVTLKNSAKKTLKVTWKKVSKATGYKVVYSTDKKFSKAKTKTVTVGKAKNNVTIKKLKKGKTYYVKVCAYKKTGKTTVYGNYSTVKKIKIKK